MFGIYVGVSQPVLPVTQNRSPTLGRYHLPPPQSRTNNNILTEILIYFACKPN